MPAGGSASISRDFVVGRDLGEVASTIETVRAAKTGGAVGKFHGKVTDASGPVAGVRVVALCDADTAVLDKVKPTTLEWLDTAKRYVSYANQACLYDDVKAYLDREGG